MKHNPGRKSRRKDIHGKPQTLIAIGVLKPTVKVTTHQLTNKRIEMLKKHPDRMLPSEKDMLKNRN
jgi:hypothetical protein